MPECPRIQEPSFSSPRPIQTLPALLARPAPVSSSNEAAAELSFATPHTYSPCPLWPIKVQLLRRSSGGPRPPLELSPNCMKADDGTLAGDTAGRLVPPGGAPTCLGIAKAAHSAVRRYRGKRAPARPVPGIPPPPRGELRAWSLPLHPSPPSSGRPFLGPAPEVCSPGQCPGPRPGLEAGAPRCQPRGPFGLRRRPRPSVSRPRRPAGFPGWRSADPRQSPLTWKCSAIFPGGGAGRRPERPREGSVGGRRGSPSSPRGPSAARSLASLAAGPSRSKLGMGRDRRGGAGRRRRRAQGGPEGRGLGAANLNRPLRSSFNCRCLRWVLTSDPFHLTQLPQPNCQPRPLTLHLPQALLTSNPYKHSYCPLLLNTPSPQPFSWPNTHLHVTDHP